MMMKKYAMICCVAISLACVWPAISFAAGGGKSTSKNKTTGSTASASRPSGRPVKGTYLKLMTPVQSKQNKDKAKKHKERKEKGKAGTFAAVKPGVTIGGVIGPSGSGKVAVPGNAPRPILKKKTGSQYTMQSTSSPNRNKRMAGNFPPIKQ